MINPLSPLIGQQFVNTIVLFRVPKCASSTLFAACGEMNILAREKGVLTEKLGKNPVYRGLFCPTHAKPEEIYSIFGRSVTNFLSIACVRNPFDRMVSMFSFSNGKNFGDFYGEKNSGTFKDFIDLLYKKWRAKDKSFIGIHPQTMWTHCDFFRPRVVLRFHSLQQDWESMIASYQIKSLPIQLPRENKSEHGDWREYYTSELRDKVLEIFEDDFDKWRFSREIE